jgi:PAS domain-containing protein
MTDSLSQILERGKPVKTHRSKASTEDTGLLKAEKLQYVLMVPVLGKKSPIGLLFLGSSRNRQLTGDEMEFLETCGRQLGIAIENFRLLEQVLRSQRQWSEHVRLHPRHYPGARFRISKIIKANQALLEQIGKAPSDVLGNSCESVLPRELEAWTDCPYCGRSADQEFTEGADPCFGGFSAVSTSSYFEQGSQQRGVIHVVRDVSDRRSAEERYRLLFEQMQEGVYMATPTGKLLDCNDAFVSMLGYSRRDELMVLNLHSEICVDRGSARPSGANWKCTISCATSTRLCGAKTEP